MKLCKNCGKYPTLGSIPKQGKKEPFLYWYQCRCGRQGRTSLSKAGAERSWDKGERA